VQTPSAITSRYTLLTSRTRSDAGANSAKNAPVSSNVFKLEEHQEGKHFGSYTFSRRPVSLVYYAHFMDIEQAITFEKKIKKWSRAKKQSLIDGRFEDLPNLAKKNFGD